MGDLEKYGKLLRNRKVDTRLEVLLTDLMKIGLHLDDVVIHSNGVFKRNFHYDIERVQIEEHGKKKLKIEINRNSLYDHLPEGLFHQPTELRTYVNKEMAIAEIKVQNDREMAAREFFLPYEQEFYLQRMRLEAEEKKVLFQTNSGFSGEIFDEIWDLPDFLNQRQKNILGLLIQMIHEVVGDWEGSAEIIRLVTGDDIELIPSPPQLTRQLDCPVLGHTRLGTDFILGGELREMQQSVMLKVHFDEPELFIEHLCGETKIKTYNYLCGLLIPYEMDFVIQYNLGRQFSNFCLEGEKDYAARLGFSTII